MQSYPSPYREYGHGGLESVYHLYSDRDRDRSRHIHIDHRSPRRGRIDTPGLNLEFKMDDEAMKRTMEMLSKTISNMKADHGPTPDELEANYRV